MRAFGSVAGLAVIALAFAGCSGEKPLPGERFDVRAPLEASAEKGATAAKVNPPAPGSPIAGSAAFAPSAQVNHGEWTHRNGSPTHRIQHPALRATLTQVWSADIGAGDSRREHITADPVVAGGRVFTLDSRSRVMAHSANGAEQWARDLTPSTDRKGEGMGGGLAYGEGRLFVTTGFGELQALDPATGRTLWVQGVDAPVSGAPTVRDGMVYVSTRDSVALAVKAENGKLMWQLPAAPSASATMNGAGPAVDGRIAVFPFGSAELLGALRQGGIESWSTTLAGRRLGRAYSLITDISSDPVMVGNVVYAGSPSGRIAAIDTSNGERIWTADEGAMSPVWVDGGSVFAVSDLNQLVRLNASSGEVIWAVDLPGYKKQRPRKHRDVFAHYGPVLAGGRLLVASDDGWLRSFDPRNGALLSSVAIPGGATTNPVIVNQTLYVVTTKGKLVAYR